MQHEEDLVNMMTGCSDISRSIFDSDVSSSSKDRLVEAVEEEMGGGAGGGNVRSSETLSFVKFRKPCIVFIWRERKREWESLVDVNAK